MTGATLTRLGPPSRLQVREVVRLSGAGPAGPAWPREKQESLRENSHICEISGGLTHLTYTRILLRLSYFWRGHAGPAGPRPDFAYLQKRVGGATYIKKWGHPKKAGPPL